MPDALELLTTRRSFKPVELTGPAPSPAEIDQLLTVASRVPDHGKLAPWRFIVFEGEARQQAGDAIAAAFKAKYPDAKPDQIDIERGRLTRAPLVVAVVSRAGPHVKIPEWEQVLSAGAAADEPRARRACARLWRELDHRMVRLRSRRARCAWAWRRTSASPASFISAGRPAHPRIGRGRRLPRSRRASALRYYRRSRSSEPRLAGGSADFRPQQRQKSLHRARHRSSFGGYRSSFCRSQFCNQGRQLTERRPCAHSSFHT